MRKQNTQKSKTEAPSLLARSLKYHLIQGKLTEDDQSRVALYNRAYAFWKAFWQEVLARNGSDHQPEPDDFLRQDFIGVIEHREQPIALHAHSRFDLRQLGAREHSYFARYFTDNFFRALEARSVNTVLSVECYSVAREWRSPSVGVSLAAAMVGLGLKLSASLGVDAAIAVARSDIGVDQMARNQGAVTVETGLNVHNTPVELVAFYPDLIHPHHDEQVRKLIDYFWAIRSERGSKTSQPLKKAAA